MMMPLHQEEIFSSLIEEVMKNEIFNEYSIVSEAEREWWLEMCLAL
jgi:hypothetical protein